MASKPSSSRKKSATRADRKRAAFRAWLVALAEGGKDGAEQRLYEQAGSRSANKVAETWKAICNDTRSGREHSAPRIAADWRSLAPLP